MKYLIDSYDAYMAGGGLLDKGWQAVNWFFVGVPFFILKLCVSFFLFCESVLNQSDFFIAKQTEAYEMSVEILKNFGGTRFGSGTLMGLAMIVSAYYLLVNFFSNRHNFSKALLHYLVVFLLFFGWFSQISIANNHAQQHDVPIFVVKSLNSMATSIRSNFLSGTSYEIGSNQSTIFDATIQQTFNYVNSGSLDGTMENGEKLDETKLLQEPGLSENGKEKFKKEREKYIASLEKENSYFAQDGVKTMEKSFAIWIGVFNLIVLALPSLYVSIMLTVIQMMINLLILAFPVIALASFFPRCQMLLFKFFKALVGVSFMPVVYGVFLSVLFWMNQLVDQVFLNVAETVNESLINVLSGGIVLLGTRLMMIVVKIVVIKTLWKNRYRILRFFSDGQIQQPIFEKQVNEKMRAGAERIGEIGVGTAQMATGAYTGNLGMALNGASAILPDKALNLGKEHFVDENGQFTGVKPGIQSLFKQGENEGIESSIYQEANEEKDANEQSEKEESIIEEPSDDKAMADILTEIPIEDPEDRSLAESDELTLEPLEQELPPEPELAIDTETLATIEQGEKEAKEEFDEPQNPEMMDNLNVTVDNLDELAFAQAEKAYFDQEQDQEFLANYEPLINGINQEDNNLKGLEAEASFFDEIKEKSIGEKMEDW
ncbi:hypothetical protein IGJ18_001606 [Enterococcus sp. AZ078]|uniref:hypothetical protein n=1 Tax=Enterococcus sp. AZ078 TaxID=2774710 RepID=UPI003F23316B